MSSLLGAFDLLSIQYFIVDVKSERFMYQSRRAGEDAKRRKCPAKSGRIGITVVTSLSHLDTFCTRCQNGGKQ